MARKGENIRKRKDGRWEARYKKGRRPDGSIHYGYVYASKYSEVKEKRNAALKALDKEGDIFLTPVITFEKVFDEWKFTVQHTVRESSYSLYETIIEHHLRPYFGNLSVSQISQKQIQEFICQKMSEQLSTSYIHTMLIVLKCVLKFARCQKYITDDLPDYQVPKIHTSREIFTFQEWMILKQYLESQTDDFSFGLLLCMYTGLRIGELSGLKWDDFDLENNQILIRRTVYRIKNNEYNPKNSLNKTVLHISSPKTETSRRNIPLPNFLTEKVPDYLKANGVFLLTGTDQCMEPRNIQRRYRRILEKCSLRYLSFHSLRHSFATLALQKGFDYRTLSEILGHSSASITLNIYVHSSIEQKRKNMELFST